MILIYVAFALILVYLYNALTISHWEKFDVPFLKPHPFFGNLKDVVLQRISVATAYKSLYEQFKSSSYAGIYIMRRPGLLIRDPSIIKDILVKDFASFHDNDFDVDEKADPIFANNPFSMKGDKWKIQRARHTPNFTSAKTKSLFQYVYQGGDKMAKFINDEMRGGTNCLLDGIELSAKFTTYNFGNCAIGIDNKVFDEPNAEMRQMGRDVLEPNFFNGFKQFLIFIAPALASYMTVRIFPVHVTEKLRKIVNDQQLYRKENKIYRNDFFDWVREFKGRETSIDDLLGQVGGFLIDGYGTNSHALHFTIYELAANKSVQDKLKEEIDETLDKCNGKLTYESLEDMPYLEAVVYESLRMYPPLGSMTKVCTKPYTLPPATSFAKPLEVNVGTAVVVSVLGLHNDEKYFPNPERFDPTRFLPENKDKIEKFAFLPFSDGPRACLGKKFAMLQSKIFVFKIVENFELTVNDKTQEPIQMDPQAFLNSPIGGIWVNARKRRN